MGTPIHSLEPLRVLLIEDTPGDILLIRQVLADEPIPINIRVAVDGKQAVQMVLEDYFTPDVIILDLNLPKLSGLGFLDGYRLDIPVVVFTSSSNPRDRERAMELGATEYIVKPADLTAYTRLVSQIVRKWASKSDTAADGVG
jgi:CheY-like chemotaxis protein